jgi:hypothetical protein
MSIGLIKSQDVLLLCKLIVTESPLKQKDLSASLGIHQSEVSTGFDRLIKSNLIDPHTKKPNKMAAFEFLESSVKYFFPAEVTEYALGIPTSIYVKPLSGMFIEKGVPYVWPSADGKTKGLGIKPIHDSAPMAAVHDPKLYALLAVLDAIRSFKTGRVNEVAKTEIRKMVLGA